MVEMRASKVRKVRCGGAVFLIGPVYLVGMWFGEDQRANIIKAHV